MDVDKLELDKGILPAKYQKSLQLEGYPQSTRMTRDTTPSGFKGKLGVPGLTNLYMEHSTEVKTSTSKNHKDSNNHQSVNNHEADKVTGIIHLDGCSKVTTLLTKVGKRESKPKNFFSLPPLRDASRSIFIVA